MKSIFFALLSIPLCSFGLNDSFKIMSYNIRHGNTSDKGFDLSRCAAVIAKEKPRFISLQEVDMFTSRVGKINTCEELIKNLNENQFSITNWNFAKAIDFNGGEYGVALLSREKPLRIDTVKLGGNEPRVLLICEFEDCWIGVTHLPLGHISHKAMNIKPHKSTYEYEDSDGTITADNIAFAKEKAALARDFNQISFDYMASIIKIEVLARAKSKPVFLTGDWNATPDSRFVTYIKSFMTNLTPEDTPTFHGVIKKLPFTGKGECIDYIAIDTAHKDQFNIISSKVIDERIVSDHAPVVVEVSK